MSLAAIRRRLTLMFRDDLPVRMINYSDKCFIVFTGVFYFAAGVMLWLDSTADNEVFLAVLWPWWFMVAGLATIYFGFRPYSHHLHGLVTAALPVAIVGRAFGLLIGLNHTLSHDARPLSWKAWDAAGAWRLCFASLLYLLGGRLLFRQWKAWTPLRRGSRAAARP